MSPLLECPHCKELFNFHDDELDGVADGSVVCMSCQFETALNAWWFELLVESPRGTPEESQRGD